MSFPKSARKYLDYDIDVDLGVKECLLANWGRCSSCKRRAFPSEMRVFEYQDDIFFEGVCPLCGKIAIYAYDRVVD